MPRFSSLFCALVFGLLLNLGAPLHAQTPPRRDLARSESALRRLGMLSAKTPLARLTILPPQDFVAPASQSRAASASGLRFVYEGFTAENQTKLNNFLIANQARMIAIYGEPALPGTTVRIIGNDPDFPAGYAPPASAASGSGTIYFQYSEGEDAAYNQYNFTRLVLQAFHGTKIFTSNYAEARTLDPWEHGFSDAAALLVMFKTLGSPANFAPLSLGIYALPAYDFYNRPDIGGPFYFAPPGFQGLNTLFGDFRVGVAQAAWLKVAVENPDFFKQFNALYYANTTPDLAGNIAALRNIAAQVAPQIEGLNFQDWFRRQYALDAEIRPGPKLCLIAYPYPRFTSGEETRFQCYFLAASYSTTARGDEVPNKASGTLRVFDEKGQNIAELSKELRGGFNSIVFDPAYDPALVHVLGPGVTEYEIGFDPWGTPSAARVGLQATVGTVKSPATFPFGVAGNVATSSSDKPAFFGAVSGREAGTLTLAGAATANITLSRGVFSSSAIYPSGPSVKTTWTIGAQPNGAAVQIKRNTAWLVPDISSQASIRSAGFLFQSPPGDDLFAKDFLARGANTWRMVSLPFVPLESDEAKIFGQTPENLKLGRYKIPLKTGTFGGDSLGFGITGERHELYPQIAAPVAPGRGYWLKVGTNLSLAAKGKAPDATKAVEIALRGGWNQIGVPFNRAFDPDKLRVRLGSQAPVGFDKAVAQRWIMPGLWRWKEAGGYARVDGTDLKMEAFEGYYVFTPQAQGVSLVFDPAASPATEKTYSGWKIGLAASTGGTNAQSDTGNSFGVAPLREGLAQRTPAAKPPTGPSALTLRFLSSGSADLDANGAGEASGWADSFLTSIETTGQWSFAVEGAPLSKRVTLNWGDPAAASNCQLVLRDLATGQTTPFETRSYSFSASASPRNFRIEARRKPSARLD